MITYELAKQLKDAGFPQLATYEGKGEHWAPSNKPDICYFPTLSELIEACGDEFSSLYRHGDLGSWQATGYKLKEDVQYGKDGEGFTPEEAVAKLWLALTGVFTGSTPEEAVKKLWNSY